MQIVPQRCILPARVDDVGVIGFIYAGLETEDLTITDDCCALVESNLADMCLRCERNEVDSVSLIRCCGYRITYVKQGFSKKYEL